MGAGAITNVAANYLLIPMFNITGAALATLFSYVVMAVGFYFVSQKHFPVNYEWRKICKTFFLLAIIAVLFYSIQFFGVVEIFYEHQLHLYPIKLEQFYLNFVHMHKKEESYC